MFIKYLTNYFLLNICTAIIPHPKMRAVYLRIMGANIGKNVRIEKVTFIQIQNSIKNLCCKDNSFIGTGVVLDLSAKITLEQYSIIAPGCSILTHQDFGDFNGNVLSSIYKTKYREVYLHRNAVVGADSTILAGSSIGQYSVVGAKSLVSGEVPDFTLVVGVPAKVVRKHDHCILLEKRLS